MLRYDLINSRNEIAEKGAARRLINKLLYAKKPWYQTAGRCT